MLTHTVVTLICLLLVNANTQCCWHANFLICIFMNINKNHRNKRIIAEKLRGLPPKLHISQLLTILSYQT